MKNILSTLVVIVLFSAMANAQAPNWAWAKSIGGTLIDNGNSIAVDGWGNIYTTGYFQGLVDFNPGVGIYNLTGSGLYDIYINKTDSAGNFIWAKKIGGGEDYDRGYAIVVDYAGNIYTTGSFQGYVDFDPDTGLQHTHLLYAGGIGGGSSFILKLDSAGHFVWVKAQGGTGFTLGHSLALDNKANVYVTGSFRGTTDFDPDSSAVLTASTINGFTDIFTSKFDSSGNFIWAKTIGGVSSDVGSSITVNKVNGDLYYTGVFGDTIDFNPDTSIVFNLTSFGNGYNVFISKLDSSGNFVWAKSFPGIEGTSIIFDQIANGNVYASGYYSGTTDFDPDSLTVYNLSSIGYYDIFITKLTSSGNFVWAKSIGGHGYDAGTAIATDILGEVYAAGSFSDTADFDPDSLSTFNLISIGSAPGRSNAYLLKLNANGNFLWAKSMGGLEFDGAFGLTLDSTLSIFLIGIFGPSISFDNILLINNLVAVNPPPDIFIAKISNVITGIAEENIFQNKQNIYPNPSSGNLTITSPSTITQLKITNTLGQLIYQVKPNDKHAEVRLANRGIYFLSITTGSGVVTKKVIVQ